jgi:AmmeMemoRadiSam system protein B/AmmeMemoRadiSam system protein A
MSTVHISPFAGEWYPAKAADLERLLDERFAESRLRTSYFPADARGFVVPHAGPEWSGTVAAAAYRAIEQQKPEQVILLAFPHRGGLTRVATPEVDAIRTPLGDAGIDRGFTDAFPCMREARVCDHSFEIQLPFLQKAAPAARLTPLYVGWITADERRAAAEILAAAWHPGVVFVASSDFTHYGRSFGFEPFANDSRTEDRLHRLDFECMDAASSLDAERFLQTLQQNGATVCGTGPIALLLEVLRRLPGAGIYQTTLDYQTSGEITGDFRNSVSYAALAYYDRRSFLLDAGDSEALLASAEETLRRLRETGAREAVAARGGSPALTARRGAFVSLHHEGELLGCIGNLEGKTSLAEDVADLTLAAALEDPRFRPAAETHGAIDIEISILTPFRLIQDAADFCVGRHGAFLTLGGRSGLLLPQVAKEHDWSAEGFLNALARKSGLWPGAWRDPKARLSVFEAQLIGG